jgi:osmotically-inducible protein OsmY
MKSIALLAVIALSGALGSCTAYMKCGLDGCPGDAKLAADVRTSFAEHSVLQPPNLLKVQAVNHVIYLYGLVDTDLERQIAESVALGTPGVTKVVNSIGLSGNR